MKFVEQYLSKNPTSFFCQQNVIKKLFPYIQDSHTHVRIFRYRLRRLERFCRKMQND